MTHGVAIGILLPHVIRFNSAAAGPLYGNLVHDMGQANGDLAAAAETLARRVTAFMKLAGLPTRLADLDVSRGILGVLAEEAAQQYELFELYEAAH